MTETHAPPRRLKKTERREQILLELRLKPHVRLAELATQFGVTSETIRRDVEDLSRAGHLTRAYGGASAPHPGSRRDLDERRREFVGERESIGQYAASLVRDGETIMIDAGSTTIQLARFLGFSDRKVLAITNCLQVAITLGGSHSARVILCPGDYVPEEAAIVGTETVAFIARHNVDRCFLGAAGLSEVGVTESVRDFDMVKRAMMRQSQHRHFLMDASKFGATHLNLVAEHADIGELISDRQPDSALAQRLRDGGANLVIAPRATA